MSAASLSRASGVPLDGRPSSQSEEWNIMKLTQSWPPGVCIFAENEVGIDTVMRYTTIAHCIHQAHLCSHRHSVLHS